MGAPRFAFPRPENQAALAKDGNFRRSRAVRSGIDMPTGENPFLLPPPPPPERKTALCVVLALSAALHLALLAFAARAPNETPPPERRAGETVRVLRGEVTEATGERGLEPGLRLFGYADVPAPRRPEH
jgi:hypothetical protein